MKDLTYIIPTRIESEDRLKNIITSVTYLLKNFPEATVIIKEVSDRATFKFRAIPEIKKYVSVDNLQYIFEENTEDLFHKTRILNDLILMAKTKVVCSHDVDVIYPVSSYHTAYNMITQGGYDAVYPFGCGIYQWAVEYPVELFDKFIASKFDLNVLKPNCDLQPSVMGWGQMINRQVYIDSYMWNENFISWGAEDCEYHYRLPALGYRVGRVNDFVYHFNHSRTFNSHYHNPKFTDNHNLWQTMRKLDKDAIIQYYKDQNYVKERRNQLNVGI